MANNKRQPYQAQLPEVSILDKCSNQIRAAYHSVDQQLEPSLTEVNRFLSHHPDNPAPSLSSSSFKDSSNPCRSAAAEVGKTRERRTPSPHYIQSHQFLSSTTSSNLLHTSYEKGYRSLALTPPELLIKQAELRTLFFSCEEASIVGMVKNGAHLFHREGTQSLHKVERWP